MIALGYAEAAERAMFASCRFDVMAGLTDNVRSEEHMIVRIVVESSLVVLRTDVDRSIRRTEVGEDVGRREKDRNRKPLRRGELGICSLDEQQGRSAENE